MTNQQSYRSSTGTFSRLSNKICPEDMTVEQWQVALRRENAKEANYQVEHLDDNRIWGDYLVSGKTGRYRVAFRGVLSDRNYCSCLDFRTNGLGTCKHTEAVTLYLADEVPGYPWANLTYEPPYSSLYVSYKGGRSVRMRIGETHEKEFMLLRAEYFDELGTLLPQHYDKLDEVCRRGSAIDSAFRCYDDVFDFVRECQAKKSWAQNIQLSYPSEMITDGFVGDATDSLRHKVWQMASRGYGLVPHIPQHTAVVQALALCRVVMDQYPQTDPAYIIIDRYADIHQWQIAMRHPAMANVHVILTTAQDFVAQAAESPVRNTPFVYVDSADALKEWRNPLSIALKTIQIEHLYMRISTLRTLTPVQLSSILQHISPYILGPFYRFIHTYRPIFPLKDDGSNMPPILTDFVFVHNEGEAAGDIQAGIVEQNSNPTKTSEERLQYLFDAFAQVLEDPEALSGLRALLKQLSQR